jgi:UDP-N-acetylmuramyl pentapeptide phosphotransferase/UDP-N-acetylglucosamine-1-phosphate transferase
MISDRLTKKSLEILGGIGSILMGLVCAGLSFQARLENRNMWKVYAIMSVLLVINGIAMQLHARKRDDSLLLPDGLPPLHHHSPDPTVKART